MPGQNEQIRQIAARIKGIRDVAGLSVDEMAKQLNIPFKTYESYESGSADIPVSFLYEVAGKFNVELTAILTGDEPKLHSFALVHKGKGINVERRKEYKYQSLACNFVNKKAEPFLVTVEPTMAGLENQGATEAMENAPHLYSHPGQEYNYVLEGTLKIIINRHEMILLEGDSLYFDSSQDHGMRALNGKPAKFLAVII